MEIFYGWVDQGSEYDTAVEQSIYYNQGLEEIDEIILCITIAIRYSRCGKKISSQFRNRMETVLFKAKGLSMKEYGLTEDELDSFYEDIKEVEGLLSVI